MAGVRRVQDWGCSISGVHPTPETVHYQSRQRQVLDQQGNIRSAFSYRSIWNMKIKIRSGKGKSEVFSRGFRFNILVSFCFSGVSMCILL